MSGSVPDSMELQSNGTDEGNDGALAQSSITDTKYSKNFSHYLTREALPYESNYRNLESIVADNSNRPRPTLEDLHESTVQPSVSVKYKWKVYYRKYLYCIIGLTAPLCVNYILKMYAKFNVFFSSN